MGGQTDKEAKLLADNHNLSRQVTELECLCEALKTAKEQTESANAAKSEFLANMSLDIRTLVNAIIGFSNMLAEKELTEEQKSLVCNIKDSGKNLLQIIDYILNLSKIEAGKLDIEITDCPLGRLLGCVESLMLPQAKEKGLEFEIVRAGKIPAQIRTDPVRLYQCLTNLVNNAIKFTEKGHVYVSVALKTDNGVPYMQFNVEDTGVGIPAEKQKLIFEESYQAQNGTTRKFGGAGLGLTIVRKLSDLLGGKLSLTSQEGKGSVFSLVIPAGVDVEKQPSWDGQGVDAADSTEQESGDMPQFSGKALVAEDVKTNQVLMKLLLGQLGLQVTIAEDGKEAVDEAVSNNFDLIFMDIQMPSMDGYEATKTLRERGITTPIIAITASVMKGDEEKCISAGCDDCLSKPIDRIRLLHLVRKYISSESQSLSDKIDSVRAKADELGQLCSGGQLPPRQWGGTDDACNSKGAISWAALMEAYGQESMIEDIVTIFLEDCPQCVESLAYAVKSKNPKDISLYAHRLKGLAGHVTAKRLLEKAYRLECAGREEDVDVAASIFEEARDEFEKVISFLSKVDWIEKAKERDRGK